MEAIHGVDTSWLHRPLSTTTSAQPSPAATPPRRSTPPAQGSTSEARQDGSRAVAPTPPIPVPSSASLSRSASSSRRPGFLSRSGSSEKIPTKSSWMSNLSSKFSSSPSAAAPPPIEVQARGKSVPPPMKSPIKAGATTGSTTRREAQEELEPYVPAQPKISTSAFLSGALRRLSSSSQTQPKLAPAGAQGTLAPRMTLNIDKTRDRCQIKELKSGKLKRVAFNVDVEIAGISTQDPDNDGPPDIDEKGKTMRRGEGEALKHPDVAQQVHEGVPTPRTGTAGVWSSLSMSEADWTPPRSPRIGNQDGKTMKQAAAAKKQDSSTTDPPEARRLSDALKSVQAAQPARADADHDILRHLSGMEDDWGDDARKATANVSKKRKGRGGMYDSLTLDDWIEQSDKEKEEVARLRARSSSASRRGSNESRSSRKDMLTLLADDEWSDHDDSKNAISPQSANGDSLDKAARSNAAGTSDNSTAGTLDVPRSPRAGRPSGERPQSSVAPTLMEDSKALTKPGPLTNTATPLQNQAVARAVEANPRAASSSPAGRPQDRPTTNPLRIYRRCCQLREAPVLKRISEQLSKPENIGAESDGIVASLNLNRSRMQMTDITCLSDWLAIVPVKKLLLEDANLTDEGLRQILSGLLATKTPDLARRRRGKASPTRVREMGDNINPGVIEKLTIKGNKKLTATGWRYLCAFMNMSRSIRSIDVSLVPFPRGSTEEASSGHQVEDIVCKALVQRVGGNSLYELLMADCGLNAQQIERVTRAASRGIQRLGLANNHFNDEALSYVARYLRSGVCKGLDLGGTDLRGKTLYLAENVRHPLWALSVANCNLLPADLEQLLPGLAALPDLRLLDLSHNKDLFSAGNGNASLATLRKYIPRFKLLKRLHLADVSMNPEQAIGIAEILPECRNMAHVILLENPAIKAVISDGSDQTHQEEACALFASLMTAVRLSKTLVCVDIDVPGPTASEVVKALARQVVAYCLRNIEVFTEADAATVADAAAALPDIDKSNDGGIELLQHFLEHQEGSTRQNKGEAATEEYFVGGTGVVKALSYILSAAQAKDLSISRPGTPTKALESELGKAQAKEMSKTLLESARKYRAGLQPVIAREENKEDVARRLHFLDDTLRGMIERFEEEYPETRPLRPSARSKTNLTTGVISTYAEIPSPTRSRASSVNSASSRIIDPMTESYSSDRGSSPGDAPPAFGLWRNTYPFHSGANTNESTGLTRRESEVNLHNRELVSEEGRIHRFGQRLRREVLPPTGLTDHLHKVNASDPPEPEHLAALRATYEAWGGDDIKQLFLDKGMEKAIRDLANDSETLRELELTDPESFRKYREAQMLASKTGTLVREEPIASEEAVPPGGAEKVRRSRGLTQ